jgi:hypothetical protein
MSTHLLLFGTSDNVGNEYIQYQTIDGGTHNTTRFYPEEKEGGKVTVNYNAINTASGASADRVKLFRYKMVNGVASIVGSQQSYTNNDSGMNGADFNVIAEASAIIVTITGIANQTLRHTLKIERLSSRLM